MQTVRCWTGHLRASLRLSGPETIPRRGALHIQKRMLLAPERHGDLSHCVHLNLGFAGMNIFPAELTCKQAPFLTIQSLQRVWLSKLHASMIYQITNCDDIFSSQVWQAYLRPNFTHVEILAVLPSAFTNRKLHFSRGTSSTVSVGHDFHARQL